MASAVADPDLASAFDTLTAGLDALSSVGVKPIDARDAVEVLTELEVISRRVEAAKVDAMAAVDRGGLYREDGHNSARTMVRHLGDLAPGTAAGRQRVMLMYWDLPDIAAAHRAGTIGTDQVQLLARVHANKRVRDHMPGMQQRWLDQAAKLSFNDFSVRVLEWMRLTDEDGPEPANSKNHQDRDAKLIQDPIDLGWELAGRFAAMQGASMREIWDHYIAAERLADWEKARAEHGDAACEADLPRTDAQRRADALWQLFQDAASAAGGAVPVGYVHNIVWSAETFEAMLDRLDGQDPDPVDPDVHRCETLDGTPLEPTEAGVNALLSSARRVLIDARSAVIDLSDARLFTGLARHAVKLHSACCIWPGCAVPTTACESDHLRPHSQGGRTSPGNGAPLCGRHNRWKQKGFTIFRDQAGQFHTLRPDGTPLP